jgi:putative ABC transport system permease protein
MATGALTAHKLRSALTLLGVLVGVFSIILVMTAMRALQSNIESELSQLGANTFQIRKWPAVYFGGPEGFEKFWRRKNISYTQGMQVRDRATLPRTVGVESTFWGGEATSRYAKTPPTVRLTGASPGIFAARDWVVVDGRALVETDIESARLICVLGSGLAKTLFPFGSPLGDTIKCDGINYLVVGVLEPKGAVLGGDQDNFAVIPITTGLDRYGRTWRSLSILVQAPNQARYDDTVEEVRGILRAVRKVEPGKEDDFELFSNDSLIQQFKSFTLSVRIGVMVVSSIALLAAGIGIMNIMLVSVTERTREIGIRRAVGAKKRNIITQFIMEAIMICEVGGVIGVILGVAGGNLAAYFFKVPAVVPVDWVILGLLICSVVGIVFGTYPAIKAANLDPIESLRYE